MVYVDDIIFGSTKSSMVKDFEDLMQKEFKMSSMGELTFFLGLQVKQSNGVINDVPHIRAKVAGKKILISEATIRADLLFDDENGVDCFPKQVIWDLLRDIGYEGNLAQLTFSKPLFSPQWKYLVHVLLHCLSPKRTSWEQFGTNIASALVGLATNQKFNFSLLIMNGMLGHISNGTPFLMYPRFVQLFLNKQLEGVDRPQDFIPSVSLPSKVFTFMRKHSPKFSCRITPLTPSMLEVVTALAAEEEHSTSPHSRAASSEGNAQGTVKYKYCDSKHYVQEEDTTDPFFDDIADKDADVTPDLERKKLDLETNSKDTVDKTVLFTPRTLNFEDEAGPSSPLRPIQVMESEEQLKAAEVLVSISRPRGLSIPGPIQTQPQQPTQALETTNDEEVARKIQAEWDAELKKTKPKTTLRKPTSLAQERNQMMSFLKGFDALGDLTIIWETADQVMDDFCYPLSRELMIRLPAHGMEIVEDESRDNHLFDTSVHLVDN
ncbi:putative ribonuclease H-like domain-containing protein [Tanacetum coccineum]